MKSSRWLNRFAWFTAGATLLLICSGGMVTSKGVGLAVPDWPTSFGYNMFLFPASKWVGGILFEHTHRLIASAVGLLTIVLAVWLWRVEDRPWVRTLGVLAVAGVVLQGVLGGLRVTMLKDQIGIFHACLAQAFLGLLVFIAFVRSSVWRSSLRISADPSRIRSLRTLALLTTAMIYVQLGLGATMRHQHRDLAILDFPTANGAWIPDTSPTALARINAWRDAHALSDVSAFQIWLQMAHRFGAVVVAAGVVAIFVRLRAIESGGNQNLADDAYRVGAVDPIAHGPAAAGVNRRYLGKINTPLLTLSKRLATCWLVLVLLQVTLGAWVIWSNKAADVATAHVGIGALMLCFGVSISAVSWKMSQQEVVTRSRPVKLESKGAAVA